MTNEELAVLIQNGDDGYLPTLWEQVRKLIRIKAEHYSRWLSENSKHIDPQDFVDDLTQAGYFAVIDAVKYFDASAGLKFTTYLDKTLKNAFREAAGIRTSKRDPLDSSLYLDTPCGEDEDCSILDLIGSPDSDMLQIDENVYNRELRAALEDALLILTDREWEILRLRYFFGISYSEQAANKNVSKSYIANVAGEAFEKIRSNSQVMTRLASFMPQYEYDPFRFTGYSSWRNSDLSVQDRYLMGQISNQNETLTFLI